MKNILLVAAVAMFCATTQASEPMAKLGFGGMKKVSRAEAMQVRGKGSDGYTISPYVIASSSEFVNQFSSSKALALDFASVKTSSVSHSSAVGLKLQTASTVQQLNAAKTDFTFIGPSLPHSFGHYGGGFKK